MVSFGDIGALFSSSSGVNAANKAARAAKVGARRTYEQAAGPVEKGFGQAIDYSKQALPQWQQIFGQGTALTPFYMGGLGVGTPEQNTGAYNAFMSSIPGQEYQNQLPDIWETSLRRGNVTGQTGQIPIDLTNETLKALNPFYESWQSRLAPLPYETAGAAGEASVYDRLAALAGDRGTTLSNLAATKGNALTQANVNRIQQQYGARTGAGANSLSALFGLGQLATSAFAPAGGLGLGSLFTGGGGGSVTGEYDPAWGQTGTYDAYGNIL